ncbi:MAG: hypothetical protein CLLPBCKN_006919 [Chroococcidiopsis cubana SAG 39.79]|nr:hypothetical protein [Chroococcidiopsis cubana]MDZ4877484.1 hypothetical protein [Chroococcidiopsis cubana SAG 39.79]
MSEEFWLEEELIPWSEVDFYEPYGIIPRPIVERLFDKITDHVVDRTPRRPLARYKRLEHRRAYMD